MTVSIKRISAGDGYRYLMKSVAVGDGDRPTSTTMTRYYAECGTPAGRWLGAGLDGLGNGRGIPVGDEVTEDQLARLVGMGCDPITGEPLGMSPQTHALDYRERVRARLSALPIGLRGPEREDAIEAIRSEERQRSTASQRKAVTGFDLTFSVPKSVSSIWAVADAATQAKIVDAHHAAIEDAIAWAERNVFATRIGKCGAVQVPVRGIVAAAFDHYDSRANDPHLHTHAVVSNRVQTEVGGKWRTLDSRAIFRATVALSELHQGFLMDRITQALGVGWDGRARRHSSVPQWEVAGVPDALRAEFSQRATAIDKQKDELVAKFRAEHGYSPDATTVLKLRQQATLATRPDKHLHSLADLTAQWRRRAAAHVGDETEAWVGALPRTSSPVITSADVTVANVQRLAEQALTVVADKRATFTRWNAYAEVQRQLHGVRFATANDRALVGDRVTDSVLGLAVLLTPMENSVLALPHGRSERYTTATIFDAETRLLDAGRTLGGPTVPTEAFVGSSSNLSLEQEAVIADIATSGRELDLLVGAAGTGKTSTMAGLSAAWRRQFGPSSVVGLAPSAAAAEVLGDELRLPTENTAKWTTEVEREPKRLARLDALDRLLQQVPAGSPQANRLTSARHELQTELLRWRFRPGQLVIVDEASLAGTLTLDKVTTQARAAGAKVLLVGDWAQLSAIDAGGAFSMLVRDRGEVPELTDVRRFNEPWEKQASLGLRSGNVDAIDAYVEHGRVHEGDRGDVLDAAYAAWLLDRQAGKRSLLIAADAGTVVDLNARARADLVAIGAVAPDGIRLADGTVAGIGDELVTRRNDRTLGDRSSWVKNGDRWTVAGTRNGTLIARRADGSESVTLPAEYVSEHVELGYATTAHRAQGQTVDAAHTIVTGPAMTREALYVAATRARDGNHLYVAVDADCDVEATAGFGEVPTAREVLVSVLANTGLNVSAHELLRRTAPEGRDDSGSAATAARTLESASSGNRVGSPSMHARHQDTGPHSQGPRHQEYPEVAPNMHTECWQTAL